MGGILMKNPYKDGCGRDMWTEAKGCVYCGDSEGYICDQCKFIKKLMKICRNCETKQENPTPKNQQ